LLLGYTLQRPTDDRYLMTRDELEQKLAVLLGGRAAEDLVFARHSTGAADDLARATEIARSMVTRYGMNEQLGPMTYDEPVGLLGIPVPAPPRGDALRSGAATLVREGGDRRAMTPASPIRCSGTQIARATANKEDFIVATTTPTTGTNTTRNRAPRKRAAKKTTRAKTGSTSTLARLQQELPPTLRDFSRRMRRGLSDLEKRIEQEGRVARRQGARMLRQASHRLGQLEAQGEREWRKQSLRARRAAVRLLHQLERSIEPQRSARGRKTTA